jgi:hypothetical protein
MQNRKMPKPVAATTIEGIRKEDDSARYGNVR